MLREYIILKTIYPIEPLLKSTCLVDIMDSLTAREIVVFSGGSAANSLVDVFNGVAGKRRNPLSYIIGVYCLCPYFYLVTDGSDRSVIMAGLRAR